MRRFIATHAAVVVFVSAVVTVIAAPAAAAAPVQPTDTNGTQINVAYDDEPAQSLSNSWPTAPRDVAWILDRANRPLSNYTCQTGASGAFAAMAAITPTKFGFCWNADDSQTNWMPQGITSTHDALAAGVYGGREAVAVTWHNSNDMNTRLSLAPGKGFRSGAADNYYRHLLLVKPRGVNSAHYDRVGCHAGGAMWYGRLLYVACTNQIRIFSWDYVHSADTSSYCADKVGYLYDPVESAWKRCADAYAYVMFQVGTIDDVYGGMTFSTLSLDRAATPDKLVIGSYTEGAGGKLYRYNLDYTTRLPAQSYAFDAYVTTFDRIQGATTRGPKMWFHSSGGSDPHMRYWDNSTSRFAEYPGAYGAQSLSYWADSAGPDMLYTLSEHPGKRAVLAVEQSYFN